jgi:N-methylhydantoinase B
MQIGHFMTEIVYRALAPALPDRVIAGSGGTPATMNVFYGRRGDDRPFHCVIIRGGGMGAGSREDGRQTYIFPANGANTPVEIFESDTPLLIERRELIPDSGGAGKRRGGLGRREVIRVPEGELAPRSVSLAIQSGRFRRPAEGLFGGKPGALARFLVNGEPGNPYGLTTLKPGDVVVMDAAGGGGFGDPREREAELAERDAREGYAGSAEA